MPSRAAKVAATKEEAMDIHAKTVLVISLCEFENLVLIYFYEC